MIEIYVITNADMPLEKPQAVFFSEDGGSIGRSEENTMVLLDPERLISRAQAQVYKEDGRYFIENLSSTSPILVGDTELNKLGYKQLENGVEIKIGLYVLGVRNIEQANPKKSLASAQTPIEESRIVGQPIDDPLSMFGGNSARDVLGANSTVSTANSNNPFADLMDASSINLPNATVVESAPNFSGFEADIPDLSKDVAYKPMPMVIPEDFDAFSMPSAAKQHVDNPLAEFKNNAISLKGIYEIDESADKLIDHGVLRYDLNANDLHTDHASQFMSNLTNVDPMAMFDATPSLLPDNIEPQYSLPNHGSELRAPFTALQNKAFAKNHASSQKIDNNLPNALPDVQFEDAFKISDVGSNLLPADVLQTILPTVPKATLESIPEAIPEVTPKVIPAVVPVNPEIVSAQSAKQIPVSPLEKYTQTILPTKIGQTAQTTTKQTDSATSSNNDLLEAFLFGAGISGTPLVKHLDAAFMTQLGQMLQICVSGAVDLIQARAATKREFRSEVTMIVTKGNNPLKFSPDGQAAMIQLLGKPFPGFISAVPALQDTFEDLRAHEVGMIVGTRAALHEVLQRFSPTELEKRLTTPTLLQSIMPSQRKAHLWKMYNELFEKIFDEAEDDFETVYGRAFRDAYEAEVERLQTKTTK